MDSFCPIFRLETPVKTLRHMLPLPPRPQPEGWWLWPNAREAQRRLAAEVAAARHVLVDDYDSLPEVRRACRDFLAARPGVAAEYIDDGLRGNLLLTAPGRQR